MTEPTDPLPPDGANADADPRADGERDAWLREALRHAPDAAMAPPPLLREAILSQARSAVAGPPRRASAPGGLLAFWSWLARPPIAAGFASVVAATLVGMMWWDRPMGEALPPSPASSSTAPAATVSSAEPVAPVARVPPVIPTPAAAPPAPATAIVAEAPRPFADTAKRSASTTPAARAAADASAKEAQRAERHALGGVVADAALPPSPASPATPPVALADKPSPQAEKDRAGALAKSAAPSPSPSAQPIRPAPLRDALAPDPSDAIRALAEARTAPAGESLRRWLAEVDAAAAGRWRRVDEAARRREDASPRESGGVRVQAGGQAASTLRIEGNVVTFESGDSPPQRWRAELSAAAAERLRSTQPRQPP